MSRHKRKMPEGRKKKQVACCGKTTYPTQGKALRALHHVQIQAAQAVCPPNVTPNDVYQCLNGRWHMTAGKGVKSNG